MAQMAVAVMPIADVGAWQEFADEITTGARATPTGRSSAAAASARRPSSINRHRWET